MRKYFSVEKAAEIIISGDSDQELDDPQIVILPPENVNSVTDEEDINEDCLDVEVYDVPGFVEIHYASGEMPQSSSSSEQPSKKRRRQSKINWKKGETLNKIKISSEKDSEPQDLQEKYPILSTLDPIDLYKLFFDAELLDLCVNETNKYALQKVTIILPFRKQRCKFS